MGLDKNKRPLFAPEAVTTKTSTDSALEAGKLNFVTSTSTAALTIPSPRIPGDYVAAVVDPGSTDAVLFVNPTTATLFFGSTDNAISVAAGGEARSFVLISNTTSAWAIISRSTGVTASGSTVS